MHEPFYPSPTPPLPPSPLDKSITTTRLTSLSGETKICFRPALTYLARRDRLSPSSEGGRQERKGCKSRGGICGTEWRCDEFRASHVQFDSISHVMHIKLMESCAQKSHESWRAAGTSLLLSLRELFSPRRPDRRPGRGRGHRGGQWPGRRRKGSTLVSRQTQAGMPRHNMPGEGIGETPIGTEHKIYHVHDLLLRMNNSKPLPIPQKHRDQAKNTIGAPGIQWNLACWLPGRRVT